MPDIIDANTSNVSTLTTDLNVFPYYDDFDALNNYYRLLFRPGRAVQARELTQIQSTLQNQIAKFGQHVFKEGSIVIPGGFDLYTANTSLGPVDYVKVKDTDDSNSDITIENFKGLTVTGATSNVTAVIRLVADGSESSSNTKTIYVDYTAASNSNSAIKTFQADEVLTTNIGNLVAINTAPTGKGSTFKINEGVFYAKEHFISFDSQEVILSRYNSVPSAKVGFLIEESIVQSSSDATLLDPALGSSNYAAPGADRLKLNPILSTTSIDDPIGAPDFVTMLIIRDGLVTTINERSQYNILQREFATRTYDESGDYYVRGHDVSIREHLDDGVNGGRYTANTTPVGNSSLLSIEVSPGKSYVKGFEVGTSNTVYLSVEKALDYENVNSQIISTAMGQYLTLKEFRGDWTMDTGLEVNLYDAPNDWLTASNTSPTGNNIGTARIKTVEYSSGTLGTPAAQVNVYLFDIRMTGSNNFSSTKSIYFNQTGSADLAGDVVLTGNSAVLQDVALNPLLYYTGSDATKTLAETGTSDTTFSYRSTSDETLASGGTLSISLPAGADQFPYGTTTLSDAQKREIFLNFNEDATVNVTAVSGGTALSNTGNVLTGSGTTFTDLNVGDKIEIAGIGETHRIYSITNDTTLTVVDTFGTGTIAGNVINKVYKTGDLVDLTTLGIDAGIERSVSATSSQLDIDLKETFDASKSVTVSFRVAETEAIAASKTLRPNRFVRINVAAQSSSTGPFNLGVSDVFQIREIRQKTGSTFTANSEGTVVTTNFRLDNGQRDAFYNHASITPKTTLAGNEYLLVELDYFEPSFAAGQGFFSVDSYPVNDGSSANTDISTAEIPIYKSPTSDRTYNLRNHMDFRPVFTNTAADSTTVGSSTENPATSSALTSDANGLRIPAPSSTATIDYSYYLARRDIVVVNKEGRFSIIKGVPDASPRTPTPGANDMALASISLAPFPSISPQFARTLGRKDIACSQTRLASVRQTMRDIGVIKSRVQNLEYYASLSLLDKAAIELRILDENGLDRFKNGIFVDTFAGHSLGDTTLEDYNIVVDREELSIRPIYTMDTVGYNYISGSNVQKNGDYITLPYTEKVFLSQNNVTTTRNTERNTYRYIANLYLTPELDFWVDTQFAPDQSIDIGPDEEALSDIGGGTGTTWGAWTKKIIGYKVYNKRGFVAEYTNYDEAYAAAQKQRLIKGGPGGAILETIYENERIGTEENISVETDTIELGDFVKDVSLIEYIRPQTIVFAVLGLKPYAKHYVFFDGVDMSSYSTPLTSSEYEVGASSIDDIGYTASNEGDEFIANENGTLYGMIRLPQDNPRFVVGSKKVVITDSPTNDDEDATSIAENYFDAQGLIVQKQNTILTTRSIIFDTTPITETEITTTSIRFGSCLAYSFLTNAPEGQEGMFITSVDLFIAEKHPTLGMWVEILAMDNAGGITNQKIPFSEVWLTNDQINISTDGLTNATTITFSNPIFLENNTQYAFVIHPEATNPNLYVWTSRIGQTDINTGLPVTGRLATGTTYTTNNGRNWDIVPDVDVTLKMYRASFTTGVSGQAVLGTKPREKFTVANVTSTSGVLSNYGSVWSTGDKLTLTGISAQGVNVGDTLYGNNSTANSTVLKIDDGVYYMSNTGYQATDYLLANSGATANISAISTGRATLDKFRNGNTIKTINFNTSNGNFEVGDVIFPLRNPSAANADVTALENYRYSLVNPNPMYLKFDATTLLFDMRTKNSGGSFGSYIKVNPKEDYYMSEEKYLFSLSHPSGEANGSNQMRLTMSTNTEYLSPVVDLGRTHTVFVDNIINANTVGETNPTGGALYNRYISKTITLADGQDAEDLRVILTAYRPPVSNSDIKVYAKILHAEDSDTILQRPWIELEKTIGGDETYSSAVNRNNFKEYTFSIPAAYLTGENGEVQYTNESQSIPFTGFKYFKLKIGLTSDDSSQVPRVADLRAIALQI